MAVEPSLHDNGPDVNANVKGDDGVETDLGAATLAEIFRVEDEAETEAADANRIKLVDTHHNKEADRRWTYMQRKGEIREERARARTEK